MFRVISSSRACRLGAPFGALPPIITDIDLSVDGRFLYVPCWATVELKQFDVSDPADPKEAASVRLGGIVRRTPHPSAPDLPLAGGPQSRSAETADGSTSPTPCTGHGTTSSTPTGSVHGWPSSRRIETAASPWTRPSSRTARSSAVGAFTRFAYKVATPPLTPIATAEARSERTSGRR